MDIAEYEEVPNEKDSRLCNWLLPPEIFNIKHSQQIESFVNCYLIFYGTAGKCSRCCALNSCLKLNKEI